MNQQRTFHFLITCLLSVSLLLTGCAGQQSTEVKTARSADCITSGWPHDHSDLKPDPSQVFGTLANGLRYVILPNQEPKNRVGMYLNIQAGSLYETDDQRGLAHFLEHMLFNGTTHYPPGTLVEYFQSIGMGFGADTNAHTSYNETVYKLMLPGGDKKTLDEGFVVMADYARGALLLKKEVDKERGIILAEKRSRDSARSRVFKARMKFVFAGTRIAERDVIGTDETLNQADSALLRQYYDSWYRPDNMILVVAGDTDPDLVQEMIRQRFSELRAGSDQAACPDFGRVAETGTDVLYIHEPDLGYTNVIIESVWNTEPRPDTLDNEVQNLQEYVGAKMLDNRLQHLVNMEGSPMTRSNVYSGRLVQRLGNISLDAGTSAEDWQQALVLLNTTLRQALIDGFSEPELDRVKNELLTMLKKQVQVADSRDSRKLADGLIRSLNKNEVYMSPAQELTLYGPIVEKMTLVEANEAFNGLWHERRIVEVTGTADLRDGNSSPEAVILQAFQDAEKVAISPWVQQQEGSFPYLLISEPAATVDKHIAYSEIGVDRYLFTNGLILNLKQTDFQPNEINVAVVLGHGRLTEPLPGLGMLAERVVGESGLGGLTKEQLMAALAPYSSRVHFRVAEGNFNFTGKGLSNESELLFQLLFTHIKDPAFRVGAFQRSMDRLAQMYGQLESSVEGMMQLGGERFLAGGNQRYGIVPLSALEELSLEQVENWLVPVFKDEALEISVVGDFDRETILRLVGLYFGGQRENSMVAPSGSTISFPSGKELTLQVSSVNDKAMLTVAWPTDDFWDISRTRRLSVLASVLDDRLRKQIREELGATYSPVVYNRPSRVDPGFGVLRSQMIVAPSQADMLTKKLKEVGARLAEEGVSKDELERALEPVLTSIRDLVRTNRYWLGSVLTLSSRHPKQLEWPLTIQKDFAAISLEDISTLAAKYLQSENAAEVVILSEE
ncbi:MAG: insulinase family protein [Thermodesulfobacteriota bacterium]|nr:insulinase family protein [Thermodesulfobacteriota bacterium]